MSTPNTTAAATVATAVPTATPPPTASTVVNPTPAPPVTQVQPQVSQTPPASLPTKEVVIEKLKQTAEDWITRFAGKVNHNPYHAVQVHIQPLIDQLTAKDAVVTVELLHACAALPTNPPVVNKDFVPATPEKVRFAATAAVVGEKNAKE